MSIKTGSKDDPISGTWCFFTEDQLSEIIRALIRIRTQIHQIDEFLGAS